MVKQTKRARKFQSSGGVSARLKKGTVTNKGKLKRRGGGRSKDGDDASSKMRTDNYSEELEQKRVDEEFTSKKNLGDMDLDSFFSSAVDDADDGDDVGDAKGDSELESDGDDDNDNDDDDDDDDNEEKNDKDGASDDDSGSDDEDVDAIENRMKQEIENDPDFHQFLQENDETLLDFANDDVMGDDGDDDDDDAENNRKPSKQTASGMILVTPTVLKRMEQGAFKSHGVKGLKKLVNAYKSACHMSDADQETNSKKNKYHIESSVVFDHLMVTAMGRCHEEFRYHLLPKKKTEPKDGDEDNDNDNADDDDDDENEATEKDEKSADDQDSVDDNKPIHPGKLEKSKRWKDVQSIIQLFIRATMHLLTEAKEPALLAFVLKALVSYIPFCSPFPRLSESLLKTLVSLWSAAIDNNEDYQVVRLHAFLRIRQLTLTQPFPFIETSLKKVYLAYAQRAKFTASSTASLPTLTFMGNCIVELYSLDYHSSYQHAFIYIRQLALLLRSAMQKKTPETFAAVYCWQFMHCLKLWVAVLTAACQHAREDASGDEQLLESLLFPLSQVIIGTCRLIPSARYLPLRLHCVRLLQQLAGAAEVFLPTTSILLDTLDIKELFQQPKKMNKSTVQPLSVTLKLRADHPLRSMEELEMCVSEIFVLLNREMDLYRYSAGYPEFCIRVVQRLRKFSKDTRNARWRAYSKGCIDMAERYQKAAVDGRSKLIDIAPKDVKRLEILKPINAPSMGKRLENAIVKEKRLEVATRPAQKASTKKKRKEQQDNNNSNNDDDNNKKSNKKQKKTPKATNARENLAALEEEDEVQMGINWSDDEDED
mmetsp:Transcript_20384/g.57963  ORF Transcript_20384/g.57963 Transcript_20384/m.57963 type:complete len:824 (-) Transcript_20384:114-2585(-)|eukprot:CAMPEP_0119566634 /NCGR_PEP_ID=MMETSP1352-20130426/33633_1 /TAXON_ID=265584 /ORGANISM="Stauroneis constricta, Strain CCMP1120" /LENGTH=823 /DNA_ID=CAMNT_0007615777 /DNA_START=33 /DNA_END=2504 /DNA_ORIENTATION=-